MLAGCSASSTPPDPGDAAEPPADAEGADGGAAPATYSAVWDEILNPTCALPFCHAGSGDYLQLSSKAVGYASLVNAPAAGPDCGSTGLLRVDPGHPETSLLYLKITSPPCGSKMPIQYGPPMSLSARQVAQIHDWIAAGAAND